MFLAPMDGFTDIPFRILCQRHGAEYSYTEMISVAGFTRKSDSVLKKAYIPKNDNSGLQFFGTNPHEFETALTILSNIDTSPKSLDLNMGCPVAKVMNIGAGASLLKHPKKVDNIIKILTKYPLPVSVKIRLGIDRTDEWKNVMTVFNDYDLQHITVHLRTVKQMYSGKAQWELLEEIISKSNNPIIANGDIKDQNDAEYLISMGAKNVMVGRAALSNPFMFEGRVNSYDNAKDFIKEYEQLAKEYDCYDHVMVKRLKTKIFRGFKGAKKIRKNIT